MANNVFVVTLMGFGFINLVFDGRFFDPHQVWLRWRKKLAMVSGGSRRPAAKVNVTTNKEVIEKPDPNS